MQNDANYESPTLWTKINQIVENEEEHSLSFLSRLINFFRRKIFGVISHSKLVKLTNDYLKIRFSDKNINEDLFFSTIKNNREWRNEWFDQYSFSLKKISNANNRTDQCIRLRKEIMNNLRILIFSKYFYEKNGDERPEEEKNILCKHFPSVLDVNYELASQKCSSFSFFSQVNLQCMRYISIQFGDAKLNDWFFMYSDIYSQFTEHLFESIMAKEKKDYYMMEMFVNYLKKMVDDAEDKISSGYNWDYDKKKYEDDLIEKEQERKSSEPSKRRVITNNQIDNLSEYLLDSTLAI